MTRRWVVLGVAAALTAGAVTVVAVAWNGNAWQHAVAERGHEVMPFDLDRTTHRFTPTPQGGYQAVTADDPADSNQIALIRDHLAKEAKAFAVGDFTDPATIHGQQMPGLAALKAGAARIGVTYADLPSGASLTYTTTEPDLIQALHDWFAAQTSDHGSHAA